jgi:hypothetical protein
MCEQLAARWGQGELDSDLLMYASLPVAFDALREVSGTISVSDMVIHYMGRENAVRRKFTANDLKECLKSMLDCWTLVMDGLDEARQVVVSEALRRLLKDVQTADWTQMRGVKGVVLAARRETEWSVGWRTELEIVGPGQA